MRVVSSGCFGCRNELIGCEKRVIRLAFSLSALAPSKRGKGVAMRGRPLALPKRRGARALPRHSTTRARWPRASSELRMVSNDGLAHLPSGLSILVEIRVVLGELLTWFTWVTSPVMGVAGVAMGP